jgi:hypothetical protein
MPRNKVSHVNVKFSAEEMAYDPPAEVDFSSGIVIRGLDAWKRYVAAKQAFAKLAPDVRKAFPDDQSVNKALRSLIKRKHRNGKHRASA